MNKTLVVLAAGMGSRFGGLKQIEPVGPNGEFIIDYSVYDAIRVGFNKVIFIIKEENLDVFKDTIGKRISNYIEVEYAFKKDTKGERHGSVAERILAANRPINILGKEEEIDNNTNNKGFNSVIIKNKGPNFDINKAVNNFKNSNVQFSGNNNQVKPPSYPPNKH